MTTTQHRATTRETTAAARSRGKVRPIVVTLTGGDIVLRLKGEHKSFRLPVAATYAYAVQVHLAAVRYAKKAARDAKRKARAA